MLNWLNAFKRLNLRNRKQLKTLNKLSYNIALSSRNFARELLIIALETDDESVIEYTKISWCTWAIVAHKPNPYKLGA